MGKLVVLKLDGDLETRGFTVNLEIGEEGERAAIELSGRLPSSPELAAALQHHWQETYRNIGAPYRRQKKYRSAGAFYRTQKNNRIIGATYRIKPQEIIYDGFVNKRIKECYESAHALRSRMMAWLKSESFRDIDTLLREELNRDEEIRFIIRTKDKHLQKLPWHLWDFFEHYPKAEVALSAKCARNRTSNVVNRQSKVRILAILGHSEGINIDADRQLLESLPNAETVFLAEPNRKELNDQLCAQAWDIIFFAGHSETEGETGKIYINKTENLTINELWYALRYAVDRGLKLAIFNSCDGLGLARQLDDLQIPQMIVMRELVPDQVAQEFLKNFLTAFAGGQSLYLAVRQARERLQGLENKFPCATWLPTICQNLAEVPPTWEDWLPPEPIAPPKPPNWEELEKPESTPKPKLWGRVLGQLLLTSVVVTSFVTGVRSLGWLHSWELNAFDRMMRLRPNEKRDERLLIVEVTKDDIERLKDKYPLSDLMMLRLLKKLDRYKPQVIGLDIYRDMPEGKGRAELIQYLRQSDRAIAPCVHPEGKNPGIEPPTGIGENKLGFLDVMRDQDGIIRRHLLALDPPDKSPCPANYALSSQLALHYLASKGYSLKFPTASTWKIGPLSFERLKHYTGFYQEPEMTGGHQIMLNYRSYNSVEDIAKRVTLTQVMTDRVNPNLIGGRIVLIGVTDLTLAKDDFNTPYNQEIRGLVLHAQMVSQLVSAIEDRRPLLSFWPFWGDVIWIGVWSFVGGAIAPRFQSLLYRGMTIGVAVIIICGICFIFLLDKGVLVPLVPSALALLITGSVVATNKTYQKQQ